MPAYPDTLADLFKLEADNKVLALEGTHHSIDSTDISYAYETRNRLLVIVFRQGKRDEIYVRGRSLAYIESLLPSCSFLRVNSDSLSGQGNEISSFLIMKAAIKGVEVNLDENAHERCLISVKRTPLRPFLKFDLTQMSVEVREFVNACRSHPSSITFEQDKILFNPIYS